MCGRYYYSDKTNYEVEEDLELESGSLSMDKGDVTPAMNGIVLTKSSGSSEIVKATEMFWGLAGKDKKLVINARAESVFDKPMFSGSMETRRCIMPAAGFYEWDKEKNKVTFFRKDKRPVYLAGFYSLSDNKDSFVILTTAANESMISVHDRMPVMIEKEHVKDWLYDTEKAKKLLAMPMPQLDSSREYEQLSLF
jgi:putative SOS response-associated peptidase YedK